MRRIFGVIVLGLVCVAGALAAETPSPALLVLNKEENALAIVDPAARTVVARIPVGEAPHEVTTSSDGKLAFVSNYGSRQPGHTISVIDLVAQKETHRVDLSPMGRPHGLTYADGKVYFTAEASKLIGRYDPATNQVDWLLGTGQNTTHMILLSKDRNTIFTSNIGSDSMTIIERAPSPLDWNETVVPVGKGPEGFDLSPDGKELWAAHSRDGGVSIIDVAAKKVTQTLSLGTRRSNRLKFTPDGKRVFISDMGGGELLILDAATRRVVKRLKPGASPEGILMTPDGSRAYVAVAGENQVAVIDLKTLEVTDHIATGKGPDGMAWAERQ
ncbi:MAG TPA: beta-propeller fold lactonase family protein [Terriglobia bacterium]|nr:beta-propeller fold lactonase family protein [Terriglobia bacterium]